MNVTLSLPELGQLHLPVQSLTGSESLGRPYQFEIALGGDAPDALLGSAATLQVGERSIVGVVTALRTDESAGAPAYRVTLVPRIGLLGLSRRSRSFERMTTPEIVAAVLAESDLELELRLSASYAVRPLTVQHRESDLDFVLRLLEREGIAAVMHSEGGNERLLLTDHNGALPRQGAFHASDLRSESKLLPRRVELFGTDPERPSLPLRATAVVSERGVGALEVHDESFRAPEDGPRAAELWAERVRSGATVSMATLAEPGCPGLLVINGRELCVVEVEHGFAGGAWHTRVKAIPGSVPFRPERRVAEPRILGISAGQIAPRAPGQSGSDTASVRVRDRAGAASDRGMVLGAGQDTALAEGTPVLWGCLEGDPERPVITSLPGQQASALCAERVVLRTQGGATMELAGSVPLDVMEGDLQESPPAPLHHTTPAGHAANTYLRFAIPHGSGWSYIRAGEAAASLTSPSAFDEKTKYDTIKREGYAAGLGNSWADNAPGFFDYTDGARTQMTRGDWEHVVDGTGRLAIVGGGTSGNTNFELIVGKNLAFTQARTPVWAYTTGAKLDYYGGLKAEAVVGGKVDVLLGGKASIDVGFLINTTAGYKLDFVYADSFEIRKGEELGLSTTIDKRAKDKIQYSIESDAASDAIATGTKVAAAVAVIGAGLAVAAGEVAKNYNDGDTYSNIASAGLGVIYAIAFGIARAKSAERDLIDGDPILSLDKPKKLAALRSDDWCLLLTRDSAVLGKNLPYSSTGTPPPPSQKTVTDLTKADAEAALIIEEGGKVSLQSDKSKKTLFFIENDTLKITTKTFTIEATNLNIKGDVEIDGKLTVKKPGEFSDSLTVKGTAVKVA